MVICGRQRGRISGSHAYLLECSNIPSVNVCTPGLINVKFLCICIFFYIETYTKFGEQGPWTVDPIGFYVTPCWGGLWLLCGVLPLLLWGLLRIGSFSLACLNW